MEPNSESSPTQPSSLAEKHPLLVRQLESGPPPISSAQPSEKSESDAGQASATVGSPSPLPTSTAGISETSEPKSLKKVQEEDSVSRMKSERG